MLKLISCNDLTHNSSSLCIRFSPGKRCEHIGVCHMCLDRETGELRIANTKYRYTASMLEPDRRVFPDFHNHIEEIGVAMYGGSGVIKETPTRNNNTGHKMMRPI